MNGARHGALSGGVGFVGLGSMGWPMAARLQAAGFAPCVHDALPQRARLLAEQTGCCAVERLDVLARRCRSIVLMLPSSLQVEEVVEALRPGLAEGALVIDMSSGSPSTTQRLAHSLRSVGVSLVDAPVSGGPARAATGELTVMFGGGLEDLARARPLLDAMGTTVHHAGAVGAGQTVKALNNLMFASGVLITVEAMLIAQRAGLDPATLVDVANCSSGENFATRFMAKQQILSRSFHPAFRLDLMFKDLTIAADLARETRTTAPFTLQCRETWSAALGLLGSGHDNSAIARYCEMIAGDELVSEAVTGCSVPRG